jgi:acid phosphatase (class A)
MSRFAMAAVLAVALFVARGAAAEEHFVTPEMLDLRLIMIGPPAQNSAQTTAELEELRTLQRTRTEAQAAAARADAEETVFRFADVMGPNFTQERLPKIAALFAILVADEDVTTSAPKRDFGRPRPYLVATDIVPICPRSNSTAYPSGHATIGYYMGAILAAMVPERRDIILARSWQFAEHRLVCGVHYRTDIEAGRIAGTAMAAVALTRPEFRERFTEARAELRAALGLN